MMEQIYGTYMIYHNDEIVTMEHLHLYGTSIKYHNNEAITMEPNVLYGTNTKQHNDFHGTLMDPEQSITVMTHMMSMKLTRYHPGDEETKEEITAHHRTRLYPGSKHAVICCKHVFYHGKV